MKRIFNWVILRLFGVRWRWVRRFVGGKWVCWNMNGGPVTSLVWTRPDNMWLCAGDSSVIFGYDRVSVKCSENHYFRRWSEWSNGPDLPSFCEPKFPPTSADKEYKDAWKRRKECQEEIQQAQRKLKRLQKQSYPDFAAVRKAQDDLHEAEVSMKVRKPHARCLEARRRQIDWLLAQVDSGVIRRLTEEVKQAASDGRAALTLTHDQLPFGCEQLRALCKNLSKAGFYVKYVEQLRDSDWRYNCKVTHKICWVSKKPFQIKGVACGQVKVVYEYSPRVRMVGRLKKWMLQAFDCSLEGKKVF